MQTIRCRADPEAFASAYRLMISLSTGLRICCLQGVAFRQEDRKALQDAQSKLRHRVADVVREHRDYYVRYFNSRSRATRQLLLPRCDAFTHATYDAKFLQRPYTMHAHASMFARAQGAFLDNGLILEEVQRAASRKA